MTRQEFLQELQFALQGQLSQTAVNEKTGPLFGFLVL